MYFRCSLRQALPFFSVSTLISFCLLHVFQMKFCQHSEGHRNLKRRDVSLIQIPLQTGLTVFMS